MECGMHCQVHMYNSSAGQGLSLEAKPDFRTAKLLLVDPKY